MRSINKFSCKGHWIGVVVWALGAAFLIFVSGCSPSGPGAVLKGERLIRQGKYDLAVVQLQEGVRLMPTNAQAWNHLGLAYHHQKQIKEAIKAYRQALALDRKLSVVHYNIGCLLLEQNDATGAIDPLTSYTYLQPRSTPGWLKLATAQLRARRFEAAEASFKRALDLEPGNLEAANGLGVVLVNRRRPQEALASFNAVLRKDPKHEAALLNAATVSQQVNNPAFASAKFRDYLSAYPKGKHASEVSAILTPKSPQVAPSTNVIASTPPVVVMKSNPSPPVLAAPLPPSTQQVAAAAVPTNRPKTNEVISALVHTRKPPPPLEVARVIPDAPLPVAKDVPIQARAAAPLPERRSPTPIAPGTLFKNVARYRFANPAPGKAGNRSEASKLVFQGVKAYQARRFGQAAGLYEQAARLDPASFEAHYNLGLALCEWGDIGRSLTAFEHALALEPASSDARYNFSLALKRAGYLQDAAEQLQRILQNNPNEARAHLSLGNLYAQQLAQPALAREHYSRVLQIDPAHPQAGPIRLWLAADR